ncbi:MAG: hypothetical protein JO257_15060 [Deltaproteobacteria bacterium]|nr:hypothetical protein [Deltaproteobacteria bacterium]
MRKSAVVKLTLVPLLAASALAHAQAPGQTDPLTDSPPPMTSAWLDGAPGAMDPVLSPPGMTPSIEDVDCMDDPNAQFRNDCVDTDIDGEHIWVEQGVVRGGYGGYFWTGGG